MQEAYANVQQNKSKAAIPTTTKDLHGEEDYLNHQKTADKVQAFGDTPAAGAASPETSTLKRLIKEAATSACLTTQGSSKDYRKLIQLLGGAGQNPEYICELR